MRQKKIEQIPFRLTSDGGEIPAVAWCQEVEGEEHLIIDVSNQGEELLRIVYTQKDYAVQSRRNDLYDGYIRQLSAGSWSTATLKELRFRGKGAKYIGIGAEIGLDATDEKTVKEFVRRKFDSSVNSNTGVEWVLYNAEHHIKWEKKVAAEDRREQRLEEMANRIPDIPPEFEKWARKHVEKHVVFFEPYGKKRETTGTCSNCQSINEYKRGEIKPGQIVTCGHCGCTAEAVREQKDGRKPIVNRLAVGLLQMTEQDGLVQRTMETAVQIKPEGEEYVLTEYGRSYLSLKDKKRGRKKKHYRKRGLSGEYWDDRDFYGMVHYDIRPHLIYPGNVTKELLAGSIYRYSGLEALVEAGTDFDAVEYLEQYRKEPIREVFAKIGLPKIALSGGFRQGEYEMMQGGAKPWEILGLNKKQFNRLKKLNGDWHMVSMLQTEAHSQMDDETLLWFAENFYRASDIEVFIRLGISHTKIRNYLEKQKNGSYTGMPVRRIADQWSDYIGMARAVKMDLNATLITMPKDLKKAHDNLVKELGSVQEANRVAEILNKFPELPEVLDGLQKYEYAGRGFAVVAPKKVGDIVVEGRSLAHCLDRTDRYFEKMAKKESFIMFLRRTSEIEQPYCSLEVQPGGTIRQKQITGGVPLKDEEAVEFLKDWQKWIRKHMSPEDRALEEKSTEIRIEEYKKLREEKEKVRNGKFAGQLLADILEEDLLVAN